MPGDTQLTPSYRQREFHKRFAQTFAPTHAYISELRHVISAAR